MRINLLHAFKIQCNLRKLIMTISNKLFFTLLMIFLFSPINSVNQATTNLYVVFAYPRFDLTLDHSNGYENHFFTSPRQNINYLIPKFCFVRNITDNKIVNFGFKTSSYSHYRAGYWLNADLDVTIMEPLQTWIYSNNIDFGWHLSFDFKYLEIKTGISSIVNIIKFKIDSDFYDYSLHLGCGFYPEISIRLIEGFFFTLGYENWFILNNKVNYDMDGYGFNLKGELNKIEVFYIGIGLKG